MNEAKICFLVYAIDDKASYEKLDFWYNCVKDSCGDIIIAIIGNKKGKQEEKLINLDNIPKKKLIEYIFGEKKSMEYDSDSFTNNIDCEDPK